MSDVYDWQGSVEMKIWFMRWIVNPGIVFCFGFIASAIVMGLIETIVLNFTNVRVNMFDQLVTPGASVLGYFCALIALNIGAFERSDPEDRVIR
jgi:hypothetical protein